MAKQTFTTGQVLTASQMTSLQQTAMGGGSPVQKTASYVLVAADAGTVIQMNSSSSTTITVNTSLFSAGDSVQIQNIGTGTCTITAGTATVTTAGSLALTQWEGGTLYFTSASAAIFFDIVQAGSTTFPTFSVYRNSTQTFSASTWTKISFDTESWDTNNNFASGTFTPTVAGYYQFSTAINATSGSGNFYLGLRKNGAEYKVFSYLQSQSTWNQGGSCIGYANGTTDYFEVYIWCNGSSPSVVDGAGASWFMGIGIRS